MKIGPLDNKPVVAPAAAERKGAATPAAPAAEASAKVELSSAATLIAGAASDPTFDAAKVERIAQAIRDGKFSVNPEAIADKLIINAQELLGRKPS
jgi:negative regulator of flagellin synthesis FlgM